MHNVLESLLSGRISLRDVTLWLQSNTSDAPDLKSVDNSEFIIYFTNYIKEKCTWFLNKGKQLPPDSKAEQVNNSPNKQSKSVTENKTFNTPEVSKRVPNYKSDNSNKSQLGEPFLTPRENVNKRVSIFTLGCTPYQKQKKDKSTRELHFNKTKSLICRQEVFNFNGFPPIGTTVNVTDINNLDSFPPLGSDFTDTKARRRITPTPVQQSSPSSTSQFGKSHFALPSQKLQSEAFRAADFKDKNFDFEHERNLLKQTRSKLQKQVSINGATATEIKVPKAKAVCDTYSFPDPERISFEKEISCLVEIYCYILSNALVPNITLELFFLFEVLTLKVTGEDDLKGKTVFCSVHNCVYFAVSVLTQQRNFLYMLDNTTLSSLENIPYLIKFSPQFVAFIQQHGTSKQDMTTSLPSLNRVPFQLDEDSRANFPDEQSFISFKKQRDLFYELLREWQEQPLEYADTKSHEKFSRKARLLISLNPNTLNMYHLARLFQSQLIASCMSFEVNEVYDEIVSDIQKNFPAKFKKLQERFLTPTRVGGLCPPPNFYGIQAFFSELIVAAASPSLNQHLINIFVSKILELDDTNIFSDVELSSLDTLKDKYIFLLHTLRLLGKFLGYFYFLPYTGGQAIPMHLANYHIKARKHSIPPVDLPNLLQRAVFHGHIMLTVPWVVEYLSMMDPLAQNLEHIQITLSILTDIYRWNKIPSKDSYSILFLRLIIGWLFNVLHYPKMYNLLLSPVSFQYTTKVERKGVDTVSLIDKQLIHSCCPYLIEFKVLIFNFLNDITNKREVRKITPFSTMKISSSLPTVKQQTESEMEENFFFLHPPSLKKTSDFVAERIASKTISKIRANVTSSKLTVVKNLVGLKSIGMPEDNQNKTDFSMQLDSMIMQMYDNTRYEVRELIESIEVNINKIFPLLLSDDVRKNVTDVCCQIAFRSAVNKVTEWCDSNLLIDAIKSDVEKKVQHLSKGETEIMCDKNCNVSYWLSVFRNTVTNVHFKPETVKTDNIIDLCSKMIELHEDETPNVVKKTLTSLSVDLYIGLIMNLPELCCGILPDSFVHLWMKSSKKITLENLFLCSQNMTFLLASNNFQLSCEKFVHIVNYLLDIDVFHVKEIQKCLKDISDLEWQDPVLLRTLEKFTNVLAS